MNHEDFAQRLLEFAEPSQWVASTTSTIDSAGGSTPNTQAWLPGARGAGRGVGLPR